jgi:predicted DNA-binding transcriptional regulator YafY
MPKVRRRPAVDATIRLVKLLTLLPRAPQKVSTRQLRERMAAEGMDVTLRSIQRDLMRLSAHFAITTDGAKPEAGWQWIKGAAELSAPALDDRSALAWVLAGQYLEGLLPHDIKGALQPRFDAAKKVLAQTPFARTRRWAERVIAKPRGFQLLPPRVEPGVAETVQQALLDRKRLQISYLRPSADELRTFEISVLGMVVRGTVTYLVVSFWGYSEPRILAMHRVKHAALLNASALEPQGFSFKGYVASGELDWPVGHPVRAHFEVTEDLARVLAETRVSEDQIIGPRSRTGWRKVSCEMPNTVEARQWLLSLGTRCRGVRLGRHRAPLW